MAKQIIQAILTVTDQNHREIPIPAFQGKKGDTGDRGFPGRDGAPGAQGIPGYSPVKGKDYFTPSEIESITNDAAIKANGLIQLIPEDNSSSTNLNADWTKNIANARANSITLQQRIIDLNHQGGGTIYIPSGAYRFAYTTDNPSGNTSSFINNPGGSQATASEYYCIKMFSNVSIIGDGSSTILKPMNKVSGAVPEDAQKVGVDMFYFNTYTENFSYDSQKVPTPNFDKAEPLENCCFKNFVIDAEHTNYYHDSTSNLYNSSSKGFMFNLMRNCHWENIEVKNTIGTGIGVDCPIACSIKNCQVNNCGRGAQYKPDNGIYGASGIGIGYGYSEEECITITGCICKHNGNYGIFIEHQGRFKPECYFKSARGFIITDCFCEGNKTNYGGIMLHNGTFANCYSGASKKVGFDLLSCVNCTIDSCSSNYEDHDSFWGISYQIIGKDWSRPGRKQIPNITQKCTDNEIRNSTSKATYECFSVRNENLPQSEMTRNCIRDCFMSCPQRNGGPGRRLRTSGLQQRLIIRNLSYAPFINDSGDIIPAYDELQGNIAEFCYDRNFKRRLNSKTAQVGTKIKPISNSNNNRMVINDNMLGINFELQVKSSINAASSFEPILYIFFDPAAMPSKTLRDCLTYFTIHNLSNGTSYLAKATHKDISVEGAIKTAMEISVKGSFSPNTTLVGSVVVDIEPDMDRGCWENPLH